MVTSNIDIDMLYVIKDPLKMQVDGEPEPSHLTPIPTATKEVMPFGITHEFPLPELSSALTHFRAPPVEHFSELNNVCKFNQEVTELLRNQTVNKATESSLDTMQVTHCFEIFIYSAKIKVLDKKHLFYYDPQKKRKNDKKTISRDGMASLQNHSNSNWGFDDNTPYSQF